MANVECSGTSQNAVVVDHMNGEHLHYRIEVEGGNPLFAFGCAHRSIKSAVDFPGHPKALYEWDYLREPGECDSPKDVGDVYGLSVRFAGGATKYRIKIEHRKANGSLVSVLSNLTCQSENPQDVARHGLEVFCA